MIALILVIAGIAALVYGTLAAACWYVSNVPFMQDQDEKEDGK